MSSCCGNGGWVFSFRGKKKKKLENGWMGKSGWVSVTRENKAQLSLQA